MQGIETFLATFTSKVSSFPHSLLNLLHIPIYFNKPAIGRKLPIETIYKQCSTLVYVIDAQDDDFLEALPKLAETIAKLYEINSKIFFEIFLHKVDGDIMSEEVKAERQQVHYISPFYILFLLL